MKEIDYKDYCSETETPIFCGKSKKPILPLAETVVCGVIFFLVMAADGFLAGASVFKSVTGENTISQIIVTCAAFVLHIVPFFVWAVSLVRKYFYAKNTHYVITDKRVSVVRVADKTDVESVDIADIIALAEIKDGLKISIKDDKLVLKNLPDSRSVFDALNGLKQ